MTKRDDKVRLYLAGPMTGYEDFNYPAFNAATAILRDAGFEVINPAENENGDTSHEWVYYMRQDLRHVSTVDAIVVLPDWRQSRGASLEVHIGRTLGLPIYDYKRSRNEGDVFVLVELDRNGETIVGEADRIVNGPRQADYGHPYDDFSRTAALWTALLGSKLAEPLTAEDVPAMMRMVKESRLRNTPRHRDSLVDIAGYAGTQELVWERA